jgi:hypothetical protein
MPLRILVLSLVVAAALAGCVPPPEPAPAPVAGTVPPPLVASLQAEASADTVRFVLQVTNSATSPVGLTFPSGQSYDFTVYAGDTRLWRWSDEFGFTQAVREVTLAAGETLTFTEAWRPPAGTAGPLTVVARLTSSSHPVEQATTFRLP